jgi:hypothetical protein
MTQSKISYQLTSRDKIYIFAISKCIVTEETDMDSSRKRIKRKRAERAEGVTIYDAIDATLVGELHTTMEDSELPWWFIINSAEKGKK